MKPYNYHPELSIDPPELTRAEYERIERNSNRTQAIDDLKSAIFCLDELGHDGEHRHTQKYLNELLDYLQRDMED